MEVLFTVSRISIMDNYLVDNPSLCKSSVVFDEDGLGRIKATRYNANGEIVQQDILTLSLMSIKPNQDIFYMLYKMYNTNAHAKLYMSESVYDTICDFANYLKSLNS